MQCLHKIQPCKPLEDSRIKMVLWSDGMIEYRYFFPRLGLMQNQILAILAKKKRS
jgi:hypothetical protein